ncbi:phage antirepressor KilAC domain-containing protein [Azospirillum agricola]|uniref:phage antirepressor KilAC domain-containing protein n=1 Tax=Azospirillum agricola TaxID=1720247 RepID=UPI000A0F2D0F|nr:phage antirepressor KilAC domain-containing protein [Azospirillum agricola]SMH29495.1 Phage antirepressor protein YoqD, KilAC domain [Azospirillum lipoferum]
MNGNMTPSGGDGNGAGTPIAYKGVRVMTTERLAAEFSATPKQLQDNHANNRSRFVEGVHFFKIVGDELRALREQPDFVGLQISPMVRHLILWTERGTLNHAKILGTDETWSIHERLVDTYFAVKEGRVADPMAVLNDPAAMRGLLLNYTEKVLELEAKVQEQAPTVAAFDRIANADGSMCITDAAKALQVRPSDLFKFLRQNSWVYSRPGKAGDIAHQDKLRIGYLEHKVTTVSRSDGSEKTVEQVRVTPKGLAKLAKLLGGSGGPGGAPASLPLLRPNGLGGSAVPHAPAME